MIALDTNILVHARREEMPHHHAAARSLQQLAAGSEPWAIPWPCVYEFVRVVTHPRVFRPPSPVAVVLEDLDSLLQSPALHLLGEGPRHPAEMRRAITAGAASANLVHDAHIVALLAEHGIGELWTLDRDFSRFPGLQVRNPFA